MSQVPVDTTARKTRSMAASPETGGNALLTMKDLRQEIVLMGGEVATLKTPSPALPIIYINPSLQLSKLVCKP